MFSKDRLITGVIGHKLGENWPNVVVNLLYANGLRVFYPLANNRFTTKFGQFSSNLRLQIPDSSPAFSICLFKMYSIW